LTTRPWQWRRLISRQCASGKIIAAIILVFGFLMQWSWSSPLVVFTPGANSIDVPGGVVHPRNVITHDHVASTLAWYRKDVKWLRLRALPFDLGWRCEAWSFATFFPPDGGAPVTDPAGPRLVKAPNTLQEETSRGREILIPPEAHTDGVWHLQIAVHGICWPWERLLPIKGMESEMMPFEVRTERGPPMTPLRLPLRQ
jgi:hypothetical protein